MNFNEWTDKLEGILYDEFIQMGFTPKGADTLIEVIVELTDEAYQYGRREEQDGRED